MAKPRKNKSEREKRLKNFGDLAKELAPSPEVGMGLEEKLDAISGLITKIGIENANSNTTIKSQVEIIAQMISELSAKHDTKIASVTQDIGALTAIVIDLQNTNAEIIEALADIRADMRTWSEKILEKCKGTTFGEPEQAFKEPTPAAAKETTLYDHIDMKINLTEEEANALTMLICGSRNGRETQERIKYILTTSLHVQKNSAGMKSVIVSPKPEIKGAKGLQMSTVYQIHRDLRNAIMLNRDFYMRGN